MKYLSRILPCSLLFDITGQNGTSGDDIFYGVIPCSILLTAQLLHSEKGLVYTVAFYLVHLDFSLKKHE
jgi:hypothetical protein